MSKGPFPVEYSVASSAALQQHLTFTYELPSGSKVSFLYQGLHDTYLISNGSIHLILRIYRKDWKSLKHIKAELDVLLDLKQRGVDVSVPYKDREGGYVQELHLPEGIRYAVVFMYAPGVRLHQLNTETARLFGRKLAALHQVTDGMTHEGLQRSYYLENVFDSTMDSLSVVVPDRRIIESLRLMYLKMDEVLSGYETDQLRTGICHGDAHFENAHFKVDSGRVTFYDFDFCGNGYLLYDIGSFCHYERRNEANVNAFLTGYDEVITLSATERKLIPFFTTLMRIFHLGTRVRNADGQKNPLWPKAEVEARLREIEQEVGGL